MVGGADKATPSPSRSRHGHGHGHSHTHSHGHGHSHGKQRPPPKAWWEYEEQLARLAFELRGEAAAERSLHTRDLGILLQQQLALRAKVDDLERSAGLGLEASSPTRGARGGGGGGDRLASALAATASEAAELQVALLERGAASLRKECDAAKEQAKLASEEAVDRAAEVAQLHTQLAKATRRVRRLEHEAGAGKVRPPLPPTPPAASTGGGGGGGGGDGGGDAAAELARLSRKVEEEGARASGAEASVLRLRRRLTEQARLLSDAEQSYEAARDEAVAAALRRVAARAAALADDGGSPVGSAAHAGAWGGGGGAEPGADAVVEASDGARGAWGEGAWRRASYDPAPGISPMWGPPIDEIARAHAKAEAALAAGEAAAEAAAEATAAAEAREADAVADAAAACAEASSLADRLQSMEAELQRSQESSSAVGQQREEAMATTAAQRAAEREEARSFVRSAEASVLEARGFSAAVSKELERKVWAAAHPTPPHACVHTPLTLVCTRPSRLCAHAPHAPHAVDGADCRPTYPDAPRLYPDAPPRCAACRHPHPLVISLCPALSPPWR